MMKYSLTTHLFMTFTKIKIVADVRAFYGQQLMPILSEREGNLICSVLFQLLCCNELSQATFDNDSVSGQQELFSLLWTLQ